MNLEEIWTGKNSEHDNSNFEENKFFQEGKHVNLE